MSSARGEAVACNDQGAPIFKVLIRNRLYDSAQLSFLSVAVAFFALLAVAALS
jgi:hypothetical protein